jgi:CheY-like chemotaxis protein
MLKVGAVDLRTVVTGAYETVRMAADAKQITVDLDVDSDVDIATGDPERLQQVVWNLLSNAIKFTPCGGTVTVRTRGDGGEVVLTVADNGQGMVPEFLPFVFDRFRQADSTSTRVHGGLGLGLAIARHLVELHGGTVSVASEGLGKGSTFTVRLPLRAPASDARNGVRSATLDEEATASAARAAALGGEAQLAGVKVLVVDDEPDARELLAAVLAHHGAAVTAAASVAEALAAVNESAPDVVVSDIGMPDADGYELARRLRELPDHRCATPAVALTGFARPEDGARAAEAGFDAHMAKPVDPLALVEMVERVAAERRTHAPSIAQASA